MIKTTKSNSIIDNFIKIKHDIKSMFITYKNAKKLAEDIDIKKGESIYINLDGKFVFGDFVGSFIQENQLDVKEMTIASLSGGLENFEMLNELLTQKWVGKIKLILSGYFLRTESAKKSKTIQYLSDMQVLHNDKFSVYYTENHAKVVLIETVNGGKVTMHGSSNLRSSGQLEQLMVCENEYLYDFNKKYYESIIK